MQPNEMYESLLDFEYLCLILPNLILFPLLSMYELIALGRSPEAAIFKKAHTLPFSLPQNTVPRPA